MNNPQDLLKAPAGNSPIRALVVHGRNAQMIADILETEVEGCPVCLATPAVSHAEARLRLQSGEPCDVVVIEMTLPIAGFTAGRGGLALLHEVKRLWPDVEVVMNAHLDDVSLAVEAMRAGAFGCFESSTQAWRLLRIMVGLAAERKRNRELLRRRERKAHVVDNVDSILHNMNGPLAAISGFAELALDKVDTAAARDLRQILEAAGRLKKMTLDLLAASRGEEPVVVRERVDFARFWAACEPGLRAGCERAGVRFDAILGWKGSLSVDAEKMRQALDQLMLNALRAVGQRAGRGHTSRGTIFVRCRPAGRGTLAISVTDDGAGMSEALTARVLEDLRPGDFHGAGLGLKFVKAIVAQHQGRITVSSRVGEGTVFTITLPVEDRLETGTAVLAA